MGFTGRSYVCFAGRGPRTGDFHDDWPMYQNSGKILEPLH